MGCRIIKGDAEMNFTNHVKLTDEELDSVAGGLDFYGECSQGGNHNWTTKFDSEAHKLVRYCTKCEESLEFCITSI